MKNFRITNWTSIYQFSHDIFFSCNFSAGKNKLVTGAGIGILGALTGNHQLEQVGGGLVGLGVASSLGGHLLGKKKK